MPVTELMKLVKERFCMQVDFGEEALSWAQETAASKESMS